MEHHWKEVYLHKLICIESSLWMEVDIYQGLGTFLAKRAMKAACFDKYFQESHTRLFNSNTYSMRLNICAVVSKACFVASADSIARDAIDFQVISCETILRARELQYPPKVLGHFANFKSGRHIRPPPPPKQCWILSEVHAVPEKVFVHNNDKCLRNRPTLY